MKIILDPDSRKLRLQASEAEYQKIKIDADKRGLSVEEMMQADLDALVAKQFPKI